MISDQPPRKGGEQGTEVGDKNEALSGSDAELLEAGGDFKTDFEKALSSDNFDFKGEYALADLLPSAPNPGICVDGVGLLGLPLSEREAKIIIAASEQAPYGQGAQTLVNKEVRDTWEIGSNKIRFVNALWEPFMVKVAKTVCTSLGVAVTASPPRAELYKLLLYQAGSHFLPHKDHEKSKGMFATIIIILPSIYTGGQVHVSHGQSSKVFDFSAHSTFGTALLFWYTDVIHEVKPVESGYRFALSYDLIHTATNTLMPALPDTSAATGQLRRVLKKWKKQLYTKSPKKICYLLEHDYSIVDVNDSALKGIDAHRISHLQPICDELGFSIYLASLEYHMSGTADDDGDCDYGKRRRYDGYDDEDSEPEDVKMLQVHETTINVDNLTALDGSSPAPGLRQFAIKKRDLIPKNPFKGQEPDDTEYEGYVGNHAGELEYWYHRTVMILWHQSKEFEVLIGIGGINAAVAFLTNPTNPPGNTQLRFAKYVLGALSPVPSFEGCAGAQTLANAAAVWGDLDMWLAVVKSSGAERDVNILGVRRLVQAIKVFPFKRLRVVFEETIRTSLSFVPRVHLIRRLLFSATDDPEFAEWCLRQATAILENIKVISTDDLPILVAEAEKRDISCLRDVIVPQLIKLDLEQSIWLQLITLLRTRAETLDASDPPLHPWCDGRAVLDIVISDCLQTMLERTELSWFLKIPHTPFYSMGSPGAQTQVGCEAGIARTMELLQLCVSMKRVDTCQTLFDKLLVLPSSDIELEKRFATFFTPLLPKLKTFLADHGLCADAPPFKGIFMTLIEHSIRLVGEPPFGIDVAKWTPKKIGCGCADCTQLDHFILSNRNSETFWVAQKRRQHLLLIIMASLSRDAQCLRAVTVQTRSPNGLEVTKDDKFVAVARWISQKAKAKVFREEIGDAELLMRIMSVNAGDEPANPTTQPSFSAALDKKFVSEGSGSVVQGKRKSYPEDVIDLCGGD